MDLAKDLHEPDPEIVEAIRLYYGDGEIEISAGEVTERQMGEQSPNRFWIMDGERRVSFVLGLHNVLVGQKVVVYSIDGHEAFLRNVDTDHEEFAKTRPFMAGLFWACMFAGAAAICILAIIESVEWWWKVAGFVVIPAITCALGPYAFKADFKLDDVLAKRQLARYLATPGLKRVGLKA